MLNEPQTDMQRISVTIEQCEEQVGVYEALQRLQDNDDFNLVITKALMENEAIRAVKAEADENLTPEGKKGCKNIRICIGQLDTYFRKVKIFGSAAQRALTADKQTREELIQEELSPDTVTKAGQLQ
jgi:hypothetical protein